MPGIHLPCVRRARPGPDRPAPARAGSDSVSCTACDAIVPLGDITRVSQQVGSFDISEMQRTADETRDREVAVSVIAGKRATNDYDVFLCHNSADKVEVIVIAQKLKTREILPWLDAWELRPGERWQRALEQQLKRVKSAAVFVGEKGLGPWQDHEQEAFIREFVRRKCPVIPVILPGCPEVPELPLSLEGFHWVDFRKSDPDPFDQLVFGITGNRPSN